MTYAVTIREMKLADVAAVAGIEAQVQQFPWSEANFRDSYLACHVMFVAEVDTTVVGFMVIMMGPDVGELLLIGVDPAWQSQGVGSALLEAGEQLVRHKGREALLLEVRRSNQQAQVFYAARGYCQIGMRKNYYPLDEQQREDALLLQKDLGVE